MKNEICNQCGKIVSAGTGLYINRVQDFNDFKDRVEMNKPFPEGDFVCVECYEMVRK
jgi:hypothetical protein